MNKSDLIAELSKETRLHLTKATDVVNIVFSGIAKTLKKVTG
jgi:nucleoid DNA-binding protein